MTTMRPVTVPLAAAMLVALVTVSPVSAQCTPQERIELSKAGYARNEIDNICGRPAQGPPPVQQRAPVQQQAPIQQQAPVQQRPPVHQQAPAVATVCQTAWGVCPVTMLPVGASCACYYPTGVFPGVAR